MVPKYNDKRSKFIKNKRKHKENVKDLPVKWINVGNLEEEIYNEFDDNENEDPPILFGLENILISFGTDENIYIARVGVVKAGNQMFVLSRSVKRFKTRNEKRTQCFTILKIEKEDYFLFWKKEYTNVDGIVSIWINIGNQGYYKFSVYPSEIDKNAFLQESYVFRNPETGIFTLTQNIKKYKTLSVEDVFQTNENSLKNLEKEKLNKLTLTSKKILETKTFSINNDDYDYELPQHGPRKYAKENNKMLESFANISHNNFDELYKPNIKQNIKGCWKFKICDENIEKEVKRNLNTLKDSFEQENFQLSPVKAKTVSYTNGINEPYLAINEWENFQQNWNKMNTNKKENDHTDHHENKKFQFFLKFDKWGLDELKYNSLEKDFYQGEEFERIKKIWKAYEFSK